MVEPLRTNALKLYQVQISNQYKIFHESEILSIVRFDKKIFSHFFAGMNIHYSIHFIAYLILNGIGLVLKIRITGLCFGIFGIGFFILSSTIYIYKILHITANIIR